MKTSRTISILAGISLFAFGFRQWGELPEGWFKAGNETESYSFMTDNDVFKSGHKSVSIKSIEDEFDGFATIMQTCNARDFLGTRVRMTGYIKSENVTDWAGMWLRIDSKTMSKSLGFDNMQDRPIKGSSDWTKCEILLEVPAESSTLNYGALISGTGKIWFDNVSFEIIDTLTHNVTRDFSSNYISPAPVNLDFEY